jgi:hypothetical protein
VLQESLRIPQAYRPINKLFKESSLPQNRRQEQMRLMLFKERCLCSKTLSASDRRFKARLFLESP